MKTKLMLSLAALALSMSTAAGAQTIKLKANVPFDFTVDGTPLPAGQYLVESLDDQGKALSFRSLDSDAKTLMMTRPAETLNVASETKFVFHHVGDQYFLSQIWVQGNNLGHEIPRTAQEKKLARELSAESVMLVAGGK
jgi:hypothetical protein